MNLVVFSLFVLGGNPAILVQDDPIRIEVGVQIEIEATPLDVAWSEFLKHWRKQFDINKDGELDTAEIRVVPALYTSTNSPVRIDLADFDTNQNQKLDDVEILQGYQRRGIHCVTTSNSFDSTAVNLHFRVWNSLNQKDDGRLALDEVAATDRLLNRFDENEDGRLDVEEFHVTDRGSFRGQGLNVCWMSQTDPPQNPVVVPIRLSDQRSAHLSDEKPNTESRSLAKRDGLVTPSDHLIQINSQRIRLTLPTVSLVINLADTSDQRIVAAEKFLLAEVNSRRQENKPLTAAQINADESLDWLAPLVDVLDTDHDGQLDEKEIQSYVNLLGEGAAAQVSLSISARGRSLFDLLDTDANDQLDVRELKNASKAFEERMGQNADPKTSWRVSDIPWSVRVEVKRGPVSGRFARLRIATRHVEQPIIDPAVRKVPRWFEAQDRNHDHQLSAAEFIGSPARFAVLDKNSDGLITSDEVDSDDK